ncbi:MAG: redoxin domain-containing protein [Candidatus Rokuibacteriota bacterium]
MAELEALTNALPEITAAGASLAVVSPQIQRTPREPEDQTPLPMEHLHDRGNAVAKRYGLAFELPEDLCNVYRGLGLDLAKAHGDETWTLPMPARFVIDRAGDIRSADVDPDYTRRTEPAETIRVLKSLSG